MNWNNWESPAAFFAMGGHGLYVWLSFGVCALLMLLEPIMTMKRHRGILSNLRRKYLAEKLDHKER